MTTINSSIRDNRKRGKVGAFLIDNIKSNSALSIVSAYFTIYAYYKLKNQLSSISHLKFLFGEPTFIKSLDPEKINRKDFKIEDDSLVISTDERLSQKLIAQECAEWIKEKVEIKSLVKPNFLHGKLYHIEQENGVEKAILGSSNFTVNGLGLGNSPNIELNMVVDSDRDRIDLKKWFLELWYADLPVTEKNKLNTDLGITIQEENIVEDVKEDVLKYLRTEERRFTQRENRFLR